MLIRFLLGDKHLQNLQLQITAYRNIIRYWRQLSDITTEQIAVPQAYSLQKVSSLVVGKIR